MKSLLIALMLFFTTSAYGADINVALFGKGGI